MPYKPTREKIINIIERKGFFDITRNHQNKHLQHLLREMVNDKTLFERKMGRRSTYVIHQQYERRRTEQGGGVRE